jgi:cell division septal protein FtsQ
VATRRRATTRAAALPARRALPELARFAPSRRSVAGGLALLAAAGAAYLGARDTSVFAVRAVVVRGGTPAVRAQVSSALAALRGRSLLRVDGGVIDTRLATIPSVASFTYDRAFPNTLRVTVHAERPVMVLRLGSRAVLVSSTGRVLRALAHPRASSLPRMWLPATTSARVGGEAPLDVRIAAGALAPLRPGLLPAPVTAVVADRTQLTFRLRSGFEVRLGDLGDVRLKLAIARRILATTGAASSTGYVDVSVPERPVLFSNAQVAG